VCVCVWFVCVVYVLCVCACGVCVRVGGVCLCGVCVWCARVWFVCVRVVCVCCVCGVINHKSLYSAQTQHQFTFNNSQFCPLCYWLYIDIVFVTQQNAVEILIFPVWTQLQRFRGISYCFICVFPCIVIQGCRNTTSCNSTQISLLLRRALRRVTLITPTNALI